MQEEREKERQAERQREETAGGVAKTAGENDSCCACFFGHQLHVQITHLSLHLQHGQLDEWMVWMENKLLRIIFQVLFIFVHSPNLFRFLSFRERGRERAILIYGWMMKNDISYQPNTCILSAHKFVW